MTTTDGWASLSKREILRRAQELDDRRQAQIQRQIDSINRLIDAQGATSRVRRYEDELMTLNEQLALADVRMGKQADAIRRVSQMVLDKLRATQNGKEHTFLDRLYAVLVTEAGMEPYHGEHGRTSEGDQPTDHEDQPGSETRSD